MKQFFKAVKIYNAYSFEVCLSLFVMLGKTEKLLMLCRECYILLEGNMLLLYILDTIVNNQNMIFKKSAQTRIKN